ncbi:CMGC/CLK protein kinase [Nannizzia gypsea CBS 118893]|uniref:non-specific serine/threonine protein kinase n=1 Tax=Arthroderma gypseum (strain ATCC MYA-4604 / CBS 118893) TaxID=535722 RepID=E4V5Q4_ARTGP|nr:CMGC/CLK protein kinase [Nannizzia gypsea CBS 118893]EFR05429.1 CMGC/CLK protein kinase [Nannizzia gypsea CBS 118893]
MAASILMRPRFRISPFHPSPIIRCCIQSHTPSYRHWTHRMAQQQEPVEEQTLSFYHRKNYYPVKIGEVFNDRYQVIAKLGYGGYATVWLARDNRTKEYKTLKVTVQSDIALRSSTSPVLNEVKMLKHLMPIAADEEEANNPALKFIRLADEILEIDNPATGGHHYCIVSQPQGNSVRTLQEEFPGGILPRLLVKSIVHQLFFGLNWLHACGRVVHTDILPQNILMGDYDPTGLKEVEEQESKNPSVPIITKDKNGAVSGIVYKSQPTRLEHTGFPVLTDFGQMRFAGDDGEFNDWWMPDLYRAPEILLQLPWSCPVDMWSVGIMILELIEGRNLFDPMDHEHRQYVYPIAMAQYIGYLGHPPQKMLDKSPVRSTYYNDDGEYIGEAPIPKASLEDFVTTISSEKEKELFLRFIRRMLTWDPDERATTDQIICDPWLMLTPEEMPGGLGVFESLLHK